MTVLHPYGQLAAPAPTIDDQAWTVYLRGVRNNLVGSWNRAHSAYKTLEKVREMFGLPFIVPVTEATGTASGALTPDDQQRFVYIGGVVELLTKWADEALSGQRQLGREGDDLVIELLPADTLKIVSTDAGPVVVDVASGQPVPVEGDLGVAPVVWAVIAGVAVVSAYFVTDRICASLETEAKQKTMQTTIEEQSKLVQTGAATPEEAKRMIDALYVGAKELERAETEKKEKKSGLQDTIETVAWVGLGIAGLFFLAKVVPVALEAT